MPEQATSLREDRLLREMFGRRTIEQIAGDLGRDPAALLYRARQLGLRKPARYWSSDQVEEWLRISPGSWAKIEREGVDRHALTDQQGRVYSILVSSTSLGRWLLADNRWHLLVTRGGASQWFCRELMESLADLQARDAEWEACRFLSADHVCGNPWATTSRGLFCTNSDRHKAGCDPKCMARNLSLDAISRHNPASVDAD